MLFGYRRDYQRLCGHGLAHDVVGLCSPGQHGKVLSHNVIRAAERGFDLEAGKRLLLRRRPAQFEFGTTQFHRNFMREDIERRRQGVGRTIGCMCGVADGIAFANSVGRRLRGSVGAIVCVHDSGVCEVMADVDLSSAPVSVVNELFVHVGSHIRIIVRRAQMRDSAPAGGARFRTMYGHTHHAHCRMCIAP